MLIRALIAILVLCGIFALYKVLYNLWMWWRLSWLIREIDKEMERRRRIEKKYPRQPKSGKDS